MPGIKIDVVRVTGKCNAGFNIGDAFLMGDHQIIPQEIDKTCQVAFASIVQNAGRLSLHGVPIYVSCPDPGTGEGGNVIFKLSLQ